MSSAESTEFIDYYALLGIAPSAEISDIRRAFILKAKQHHPDAGGATEMMQQLNMAYKTLTSSTAKAAYDMLHSFHVGTTSPSDYHYGDGRSVKGVTDMSDAEIDSFLDNVFTEYRHGIPKTQVGVSGWIKKIFK